MERNRLERKNAISISDAIKLVFKEEKMSATHNSHRIFSAWDDASGAGRYTIRRYFRDGKLYITLNSSVVRNQLHFQNQALIEKMNAILADDPLFIRDGAKVDCIKELILK